MADTCETKNVYGKRFAETVFTPSMFEYFLNIKGSKYNSNSFSPFHNWENLNCTKLHFHKDVLRLLDNMHVRTIYNEETKFDLIYLTQNEQFSTEKILEEQASPGCRNIKNPISLMGKLREFVDTYLNIFSYENWSIPEEEPNEPN